MTDGWASHVLPHGDLRQLAPRIWEVTGSLKNGNLPRNMLVYKLGDGGLLIHSAIAMNEQTMKRLEQLGKPEVLIVPNGFHRLDAAVWKERYPNLVVVAPKAALDKAKEKVAVTATCEEFLPGKGVRVHVPAGIKPSELVYEIDTGDGGVALVVTDILMNLPRLKGLDGWLLKILGSTGFFGITGIGRMLLLKDRREFRTWLEHLASTPRLSVISVGHGHSITKDCQVALQAAAARLN